jgi:MFS family permease
MTPTRTGTTNPWLAVVVLCVAEFMIVLDATIVNVALPSIQRGLRFSPSSLQWVINMYTLIFGGFMLLGGRAGDLIGRKRVFGAGIVLFSGASLLNGLAQSSGMLIAGRGLQGLGGALLAPAVLSIITTTFSDTKDRAKAMALWSAIAAGGGAVGLLLGGVLTDLASWRWIFFVNVPVGVALAVATVRFVPDSRSELTHRTFDLPGAVSVTAGLLVLVFQPAPGPPPAGSRHGTDICADHAGRHQRGWRRRRRPGIRSAEHRPAGRRVKSDWRSSRPSPQAGLRASCTAR